jgi:glutamine synthetase
MNHTPASSSEQHLNSLTPARGVGASAVRDKMAELAAQGVHTLLVQFTDVHGQAKGKYLPLKHLATALETGAGFSGPSIWGTGLPRTGPNAEYYARGDVSTLQAMPWMPGYARLVGDGFVDGQPFEACPRQVLRRQIARLAQRGWHLQTGIEPEFFLLKRDPSGRAGLGRLDAFDGLDKPSYDLQSLARQNSFLEALNEALTQCGLNVLQLDHEDAHGQFEVNFEHAECLQSADHIALFKMAAQHLAEQRGAVLSMMPKPYANQPGSGMHYHISLWNESGNCLFKDAAAPARRPLSDLGMHFIAGVLHHSAALCALAAPTVNSYKRLMVTPSITGTTWAPALVAHGPNNRTATVRTLPGRLEWRLPDASSNPYLVTAGLIAAGLDGIDRALPCPEAAQDDLFESSPAQLAERGIHPLPQSLSQALDALESSEVVRAALGPVLSTQFLQLKREEWAAYNRHVSEWEWQQYGALC